jgi:hypothetical protein
MDSVLNELDAKMQIHAVMARFCRGADRLDREMMISAYYPDAWDDHGSFAGPPDQLADWVIALHRDHFLWTAHYIMNELVEVNQNEAVAETHVQGVFRFERDGKLFDMMGFGRYLDRFEKRGTEWRIKYRLATADWNRIDPVLERPESDLVKMLISGTRTLEDPSYKFFQITP